MSDIGTAEHELALEFTRRHGDRLRFVAEWGRWLSWNGHYWQHSRTHAPIDLARNVCADAAREVASAKLRRQIMSARTVRGLLTLAGADPRHVAVPEDWDRDLWRLGTPAGTVDLERGLLMIADPADRITKITCTVPKPEPCPRWLAFLDRIFAGDVETVAFVKRMVGYCLTGSTREHALFFLYGTGANGKTTFCNVLARIFRDYATHAPMETFMANHVEHHPTEIAALEGVRLVIAQEIERNRRWAQARLNQITGGDAMPARRMRQDFYTFTPRCKLMICGNHKPRLDDINEAVRRRLHLLPFTVTIPPDERDPELAAKLIEEAPAILAWAIDGALEWSQHGLAPPPAVSDATQDYLGEEDLFAQWLAQCCETSTASETVAKLYASWKAFAETAAEPAGTLRAFSGRMESRGFRRVRIGKACTRGFAAMQLRDPQRLVD